MGLFTGKSNNKDAFLEQIVKYIRSTEGLDSEWEDTSLWIKQKGDGKSLCLRSGDVVKVLERVDADGVPFLQVNFSETKILLTDQYVGFKPHNAVGLAPNSLPNVVTTPDLLSVFDAITDVSMPLPHLQEVNPQEVNNLRLMFEAILLGGESVGFCLKEEREWFQRLTSLNATA